jgi:hypothetical protein
MNRFTAMIALRFRFSSLRMCSRGLQPGALRHLPPQRADFVLQLCGIVTMTARSINSMPTIISLGLFARALPYACTLCHQEDWDGSLIKGNVRAFAQY